MNQDSLGMSTSISGRRRPAQVEPRLLRGSRHWWLLGPGGTAKLSDAHLTAEQRLRPEVREKLRQQGILANRRFRSYSLTVLSSTQCNLGCSYCFQNVAQDQEGGSSPPRIGLARLTPQTVTDILDFTRHRMAVAGLDSLVLMLFGGEPLLNRRGCLDLLERSRALGLKWASMTTNGTLLTAPLAGRLADLGLRTIQVTLDGYREDHDQVRIKRADGRGTFDTIISNLAEVLSLGRIRCGIRLNITHENYTGIETLLEQLYESLGKRIDSALCSLSFALVGDIGIGYTNHIGVSDDLAERFIRWQRRALELGFNVPRPRPHTPCQACSFEDGTYGAVVNADGTLASCWETAGRPDWQVGTVRRGYLPREQNTGKWVSCEELYRNLDSSSDVTRFQDTVDAALLDYLDSAHPVGAM